MKKILFSILLLLSFTSNAFCQDEEEKDKPVYSPWGSGILIDQQTSVIPSVHSFESIIQHRFGSIQSSMADLYGIYSPGANLRLGFNYVLFKNVQIGYGLTKENMYSDFNLKWTVFEQTRKNTVPVSVTLYGNMAISGNPDKDYGLNYAFIHRYSYFSQLIVGRKISEALSIQTAISFTHYNSVAADMDHDKIAWHFGGKLKFSPQSSFIFTYDLPLQIDVLSEHREFINPPKANLSFGYEVCTGTHDFQIFLATANGIVPQDIVLYNQSDWQLGGFSVGFVMTRLWGF